MAQGNVPYDYDMQDIITSHATLGDILSNEQARSPTKLPLEHMPKVASLLDVDINSLGIVFSFLDKAECIKSIVHISHICYQALVRARFNWTMTIRPHLESSFTAHARFANWPLKHHISKLYVGMYYVRKKEVQVRIDRVCSLFLCSNKGMPRLGTLDIYTPYSTSYMQVKLCLSMLAKSLPNLHTFRWTYGEYKGDAAIVLPPSQDTPKIISKDIQRFNNVTSLRLFCFSDSLVNMTLLLQRFPAVESGCVNLQPSCDKYEDRWSKDTEWNRLLQLIPEQARTCIHLRGIYPSNEYQTRLFETNFSGSVRQWILNKDDTFCALVSLFRCAKWFQTTNTQDALRTVQKLAISSKLLKFLQLEDNLRQVLTDAKHIFPSITIWKIASIDHQDLLTLFYELGFVSKMEELELYDVHTYLSLDVFAHAQCLRTLKLDRCNIPITFVQHLRKLPYLTKLSWSSHSRFVKFDALSKALLEERPCLIIPSLQKFKCAQSDSDEEENSDEEDDITSDEEDDYAEDDDTEDDDAEDDDETVSDQEFIDDAAVD